MSGTNQEANGNSIKSHPLQKGKNNCPHSALAAASSGPDTTCCASLFVAPSLRRSRAFPHLPGHHLSLPTNAHPSTTPPQRRLSSHAPLTNTLPKNSLVNPAISSNLLSSAKCPASNKWISAPGLSLLNASAPG